MDGANPRAKRAPVLVLASAAIVAALAFVATRDRWRGPDAAPEAPRTSADLPAAPAPAAPDRAEAPAAEAPAFDLVRVEPDGSALVAGTAEPGAKVTIFADAAPLAEVEADADGNFVAIFRTEPSPTPRALTLGAATPGGGRVSSDEVVMLLPKPPAAPAPEAAPEPTAAPTLEAGAAPQVAPEPAEPAPQAAPGPAEPAPQVAEPEVAAVEPEPEVAATAIIREDSVEVTTAGSGGAERVSLASISYAEAGDVTLAGVGKAGSVLRAYVDDRFAKEVTVGGDGRWTMELDEVAAGLYTLRIDQLAPDGRVASRVETPFQRDYPRSPLPRPGQPAPVPGTGVVTVQPGNNLWTMARLHYGSGMLYTQIFTANRELIRDPDLIYPGQIFTMPEMDAGE
jgi:nucleoid-associated protein YgaU